MTSELTAQKEKKTSIYIYGTFLKDITPNATLHWTVAETSNHNINETGEFWFCDAMENIEQPNPHHVARAKCPPVKGWAMISIQTWISWLVGVVSTTLCWG